MKNKKILIIAPFPPPHTGNSLPILKMYEDLSPDNEIEVINFNGITLNVKGSYFQRLSSRWKSIREVRAKHQKYDLVYLTVAESFLGNMRDLLIYRSMRDRLDSVYIHMLGGANMKNILIPSDKWQFKQNKKYISQLGGVVVEGEEQKETFANAIDRDKIHVINNFAEEYLFTDEAKIDRNFQDLSQIRIIFLSNMLYGKGHIELAEAYAALSSVHKAKYQIDFAGNLVEQPERFLKIMESETNLTFHGSVAGEVKRKLFSDAHIFCLPTYYPYEGQPFSIVEAYAAGCVMITTNHSGIPNIFTEGKNGYAVEKKSIKELTKLLMHICENPQELKQYAIYNHRIAREKYDMPLFLKKIKKVLS